jgi:hypothetical protein
MQFDRWQLNTPKKRKQKKGNQTQTKPKTQEKFKDINIQRATKGKNYQ